ncbi:DUF748 domain-containing protein [Roseateles saccharophilus]|uniref:Uncharacterized protein DUF748 n=1 Tax=Roseateles saccharophilus TaxID=304 RepID=A0A4R3UQF9_ROSSA|nr:DUF748 domain-containing protein [Roseateles saccharophilus]TCU93252.1 uncharacterized protein DUF748 [Roseateles saccharophilus]
MIDRRSLLRLTLRTLAALAVVVVLALLAATLALPGWITGRGAALATEALGRTVHIEQARFQPWRLGVVVEGLSIAGPAAGQPPLFKLDRLDAALSLRSLLRGRAVVESVVLTRPELRVARLSDGHYDIDDLIQRFAAKPEAKPAPDAAEPEFAVYNIELSEGLVAFDDRPVQRRHELAGLHLALPFVSTLPADVAVKVLPHLSGKLDGVAFDSRAEALPFEDDASARLSFKLAGLDLAPLAAYIPASAPLRLSTGRLDVDLALDFSEHPKQPPGVKLSGGIQLHELALTQPDGQPLLGFKRLSLPLVDVQPLRHQVGLGQILLESPSAWLHPLPAAPAAAASAPTATQPWQVSVAGLEVRDGRFTARDLALDAIQLKLGPAAWPLKQPAQLDASLRLDQATLSARAKLAPELLEADAELNGLAVERLAAWLPLPRGMRVAAGVSTKAALQVKEPLAEGAAERANLSLSELRISDVRVGLAGAGKPLLTLASAELDQAEVEPGRHALRLGRLKLDAPRAQLAREHDGRLSIAALLPAEGASTARSSGPAWTVRLAGLAVERGALRWRDAAVPEGVAPVAVVVEPLQLQLGALAWPSAAPVQAQLSARLAALGANDQPIAASAGSLQWNGRVGLAPLSTRGKVQAKALPLQLFNAYLDPAWGLHLQRAELGLKADVSAARQASGWQAGVDGDLRLGPLAVQQARSIDGQRVVGEDLLSWQALQLDGLKLALLPGAPPKLAVREAVLDEAYARLIVSEEGRFNLRDIGPAEAAAAAASAPAASGPPPEFAVERIRVNRSFVDFNDRFVRPHYSARLSELQGSLGAFSSASPAMAPLTLRGKVAGTGLLEIDGQLKPGAPLAMDIAANATDIELAPLSPYAGKYAGYAIERGKLSTKLHYKIEPGGSLSASNQIILNQLTFGDKVESPDATTLPVRFAVALLKDRNGVIDVNLPISGSLNDPQFSVGGIVWKLILNLIGKALTSPFSLFMGSDAPEEAEIAFAPGGAELGDTAKLDRIAQLLTDKPGVQLTLTGWADPSAEAAAIREQRLDNALKAENAGTPADALKRLYQATKLPNKPRNLIGMAKDLPPEQMRALLLANYAVDAEALRQLAVARAVAVRDALLARGAPNARVFLAAPKLCDGACAAGWHPHVEMSLGAH